MTTPYEIYDGNGDYFTYDGITEDSPFLPRFGLKAEWTWAAFWSAVDDLNDPNGDAIYKVIFLARHALGTNTLADDEEVNHQDAVPKRDSPLVQPGYVQASNVQALWTTERGENLGIPDISYCSPSMRALVTNSITFAPLLGTKPQMTTYVYENCREELIGNKKSDKHHHKSDTHQINHRLSKDAIQRMFRNFDTDLTRLAELDPLWVKQIDKDKSTATESNQAKQILDRIFKSEASSKRFVSITGHGGINDAILDVVGFKKPKSVTHHGGVIAFVCKYTPKLDQKRLEDGLYKIQYVDQPNLFAVSGAKDGDNIVAGDITQIKHGTTPSTWNVTLVDSKTNTYIIQLEDTAYYWNQKQDLKDATINDVILGTVLGWRLIQDQQAGEYTIQDQSAKFVHLKAGDPKDLMGRFQWPPVPFPDIQLISSSTGWNPPKWNPIPAWATPNVGITLDLPGVR